MIRLVKKVVNSRPQLKAAIQRSAIFQPLINWVNPPVYDHDGMRLYGKSTDFLQDDRFIHAYWAGMDSGHKIGRREGSRDDIHIEWRVHIAIWAACHATHLDGDFVECGVNTGILSLAICNYIDFNATGKSFYLFDTFRGIPEEQMLDSERPYRTGENESYYDECFEKTRLNFEPFYRAQLVRGRVPDTLNTVPIEKVSYLHIDMNIVVPEIAAIEFFWDKLVGGQLSYWTITAGRIIPSKRKLWTLSPPERASQ